MSGLTSGETNPTLGTEVRRFYGRTFHLYALAGSLTFLGSLTCTCGCLHLLGFFRDKRGAVNADAGWLLLALTVPIAAFAAMFWFHVRARRSPLITVFERGLVLVLIGRAGRRGQSMTALLSEPALVVLVTAYDVVSGRGFRRSIAWTTFEDVICVDVAEASPVAFLDIAAQFVELGDPTTGREAINNTVRFGDFDLRDQLTDVAAVIQDSWLLAVE